MPKATRTIEAKKKLLIQKHFPWGELGYLPRPPGSDPIAHEGAVTLWLEQQTLPFGAAALALAARIQPVLREIADPVSPRRLLARIDCSSHVKSPASILEKMVRDWDPDSQGHPSLGFHNFRQDMTDLGRIRIVANFLKDAERIAAALEEPYDIEAAGRLTAAQAALRADYSLRENHLVDSVHVDPGKRRAGERCFKGLFRPQSLQEQLVIELQVQTLLQEAWDKKDHFLIYERRRRGDPVDPRHEREIFAMSELLYVADITFDRLLREIIEGVKARSRRYAAPRKGGGA
jgi:ppGpp synthetase/RelA/SpoT-type nucleotidyltranferase